MSSTDKINDALRAAAQKSDATSEATDKQVEVDRQAAEKKDNVSSSASSDSQDGSVGNSRETQTRSTPTDVFSAYAKDSGASKALIAQWQAYESDAAPTVRQTPATIKAVQTKLVDLISQTVNLDDDQDFIAVSQRLMTLMRENKKGTFGLGVLYRSLTVLGTTDRTVNNARFALDCYLEFSNVQNRQNAGRVYNLQQSAMLAKTVEKRERFIAYFTRISGAV